MKNIGFLVMIILAMPAIAQQDPQYTMNNLNPMSINSAFTGSHGGAEFTAIYRNQWVGIENAPRTVNLNMQSRYFNDKLASGVTMYDDKVGVFSRSVVGLSQAYHLKLPNWTLSMGLNGSIEQLSVNLTQVNANAAGFMDNALANNISKMTVNLGAGFLAYSDKFWVGLSKPSLIRTDWSKKSNSDVTSAYQSVHTFFHAGGVVNINEHLNVKPTILMKWTDHVAPQLEMATMAYWNSKVGLGLMYRVADATALVGEVIISDRLRLAYSYDRTTNGLRTFVNGSHEFMLRYSLGGYKGLR